jgi:hypothetical protein
MGAVALALLFSLFNLIYGAWTLIQGIELRRTGKTLHHPVRERPRPEPGHTRSLRGGLGAGPPAARLAGRGLADQCPAAARVDAS